MEDFKVSENFTTPNWSDTPNRFFELMSETYSVLLNGWMWSNQRALEFSKEVSKLAFAQLETTQAESRKYVEDLGSKTRQGINLLQESYQEGVKAYSNNLGNLRSASEASIADVNRRLEQMQQRLEAPATAN